MKYIYEITYFERNTTNEIFKCMAKSKKRAKEFIDHTALQNEEVWLRTWEDTNNGCYEIVENHQVK